MTEALSMTGVNGCGGEIGDGGVCPTVEMARKTRIAATTAVETIGLGILKSINSLCALSLNHTVEEIKQRYSYKNDN